MESEKSVQASRCGDCQAIRMELASIVIHQLKNKSAAQTAKNVAKATRRNELLALLHTHPCHDRDAGLLDVPASKSRTLEVMRAFWGDLVEVRDEVRNDGVRLETPNDEHSATDNDGIVELSSGLPTTMPVCISVPRAYQRRGSTVTKGMVVAVHCSNDASQTMGGQPFWLARVERITTRTVTLQYFGPEFLGIYKLLGDEETLIYRRDEITFLHWNISFVGNYRQAGGKLSVGDQNVLSLDVRIPWCLPKHSSKELAKNRRKKKNTSKRKKTSKVSSSSDDDMPLGRSRKHRRK